MRSINWRPEADQLFLNGRRGLITAIEPAVMS
jgi:hypothetical protein